MSATQDCEAIEKGLKSIIFGMSGNEPIPSKGVILNSNLAPNSFSVDDRFCASNVEKPVAKQNSLKLPFPNLNEGQILLNQSNSSELIDLNALTQFTAKHIDDPHFKPHIQEIKLPHPDLEDYSAPAQQSTGVSVLFKKIQSSPNFVNLPENPLQRPPSESFSELQNMQIGPHTKFSPSHKQRESPGSETNKRKKKKKKEKGIKKKIIPEYTGVAKIEPIKDLQTRDSKDSSKEGTFIKPKKSVFSSIGKEYSLIMEKKGYKFQCHICNYNTDHKQQIIKHLTMKQHLTQKEFADKDMMLPFLPEPMPVQTEAITYLLTNEISNEILRKEDLDIRRAFSLKFAKFVEDNVPICSVQLIGSSAHGIGLKCSEVDFIFKVTPDDIIPDTLEALYTAISKDGAYVKAVADFKQKRPQVCFVDRETGLPCNILIDNNSSWKLANILSTYCKLDDRVQPLGAAVRYWAKLCEIDQQDRGTLPAFSFGLLVVHFLQQVQPPVLPVLNEEKDFHGTVEYYDQYVKEKRWKSQNTDSIGELWLKFLKFYTFQFKIGESVVCIRESKRGTCSERNWTTRFYAIEEPFLRRNIAYVIPTYQVCQFIQNCFLRTFRYFAYPQMKEGTIKLLKTDDFDALKLTEYAIQKPILKGQDSEGSDASENEDSQTPDLLNVSQDLEDHDPDITIEDFLSTVTNLSLEGPEDKDSNIEKSTEDPSSESTTVVTEPKTNLKQEDKVPKENQSKPISKAAKKITIGCWDSEGKELSKESFNYVLDTIIVRGDKTIPLICSSCKKNGHSRKECPVDDLPTPQPLPPMTPEYLNFITSALQYIFDKNVVSDLDIKTVEADMYDIEGYIKADFPDAKLSLFGSFCNGFGFRNKSDMDFCLTFNAHEDGKNIDSTDVIKKVADQLAKHPRLDNVLPITSAKVPIVKFAWKDSGLEGDISLYNTLALNNTKLLEAYSKIDKRAQILGYALKHFAKALGICDASKGSLSSYAYILMVLYFLQQRDPPVIPVLQELHDGEKPIKIIDGWNVWFYKDIDKLKEVWPEYGKNKESVAQLWVGLLNFYGCDFNWKEYVVSIKQKSLLTRFKKLWISEELAIEVTGKSKQKSDNRKGGRRSSWKRIQLAIEDPFDLSHNLGGGLSRKMNTFILKTFIRGRERCGTPISIEAMNNMLYKEAGYLFYRSFLNGGCEPPHDRGCGNCGKIGHLRKDCPHEKTCAYCRKPGHLIKNCPKKKWSGQGNSKDRPRFNYDNQNMERRGKIEPQNLRNLPLQKSRNDFIVRTFPGMQQQPLPADRLESQKKLIQLGVPTHRMPPPPGFASRTPPNPPPGFRTNAPMQQKPANYPPAFNTPHAHVPPFSRQVNKNELHSQSPPKHFGTSPPKSFPPGKNFRPGPDRPPVGRHAGFQIERHPNPQLMERNYRGPWQNRPPMQREPFTMQHKPNQPQHGDHRPMRTNPDHRPYNSNHNPLDRYHY